MPRVHRAISNFTSRLRGTHRSVSNEHLQVYLDVFVFRYNRRVSPMSAFKASSDLDHTSNPRLTVKSSHKDPAAQRT
jgi:hypothetical protein